MFNEPRAYNFHLLIKSFHENKILYSFLALCIVLFLTSLILPLLKDNNTQNLAVLQAKAFLNGRLDISGTVNDTAQYAGKNYVPFPPFPAVLMLPFLYLFGAANATMIALLLTFLNIFIFRNILKKLSIDSITISWLLIGFFLGSAYWLAVKSSFGVWHFAHVVAVTFILLAIREGLISGRGYLAGLFLGFAFLSRQLSVYSAIFIIAALITNSHHESKEAKVKSIVGFMLAFGLMGLVYLYFNAIRFDDPLDTGYAYIMSHQDPSSRFDQYGLFHWAYLPFNFIYMFIQGPHFTFEGSTIPQGVDLYGTSLTFASPFVFFSLCAKGNKLLIRSAWLAVGLCLVHMLFYYNNGWVQVNAQRFTLDFLPILMILVALSSKYVNKKLLYASIAYAVILNMFFFFGYPAIKRLGMFL